MTPEDIRRIQFLSDPQIAPDGKTIVFVRRHVGDGNTYDSNLWLVATDGASAPRAFTSGGKDGCPRWSPDGSQVAFVSKRDKSRSQIHLISSGGGEATALTSFPEGTLGEPPNTQRVRVRVHLADDSGCSPTIECTRRVVNRVH